MPVDLICPHRHPCPPRGSARPRGEPTHVAPSTFSPTSPNTLTGGAPRRQPTRSMRCERLRERSRALDPRLDPTWSPERSVEGRSTSEKTIEGHRRRGQKYLLYFWRMRSVSSAHHERDGKRAAPREATVQLRVATVWLLPLPTPLGSGTSCTPLPQRGRA